MLKSYSDSFYSELHKASDKKRHEYINKKSKNTLKKKVWTMDWYDVDDILYDGTKEEISKLKCLIVEERLDTLIQKVVNALRFPANLADTLRFHTVAPYRIVIYFLEKNTK